MNSNSHVVSETQPNVVSSAVTSMPNEVSCQRCHARILDDVQQIQDHVQGHVKEQPDMSCDADNDFAAVCAEWERCFPPQPKVAPPASFGDANDVELETSLTEDASTGQPDLTSASIDQPSHQLIEAAAADALPESPADAAMPATGQTNRRQAGPSQEAPSVRRGEGPKPDLPIDSYHVEAGEAADLPAADQADAATPVEQPASGSRKRRLLPARQSVRIQAKSIEDIEPAAVVAPQKQGPSKAVDKVIDGESTVWSPDKQRNCQLYEKRMRRNRRNQFYSWQYDCWECVWALTQMPEAKNLLDLQSTPAGVVWEMETPAVFLNDIAARLSKEETDGGAYANIDEFRKDVYNLFGAANRWYGRDKESAEYAKKKQLWLIFQQLIDPVLDHHSPGWRTETFG